MEETILVVDDDKDIRELVKVCLKDDPYQIFEAATSRRMVEIVQSGYADLILLDLFLSDGNSLDLIPELRVHTAAPILILSGMGSDNDRVKGLENGADDYIAKPFQPMELRARVKANIRRSKTGAESARGLEKIKFGEWILDRSTFQVYDGNNNHTPLTIHEFYLLETLVLAANRVLSREELIKLARKTANDPVNGRAIDIQITRIRKKLGDDGENPHIIKTVRGAGYMLDCKTEILR